MGGRVGGAQLNLLRRGRLCGEGVAERQVVAERGRGGWAGAESQAAAGGGPGGRRGWRGTSTRRGWSGGGRLARSAQRRGAGGRWRGWVGGIQMNPAG
jgi:hypothetical protein